MYDCVQLSKVLLAQTKLGSLFCLLIRFPYTRSCMISVVRATEIVKCTGWSKKTDPLVNFDDNFGKHGPILTIFSLLQQKNHGTQNLSYFSHLTFIMLPLYLAKQTLMLVSMSLLRHYCVSV